MSGMAGDSVRLDGSTIKKIIYNLYRLQSYKPAQLLYTNALLVTFL